MAFSLDYGNNDINGYFSGHFWPNACLNTNNISDDMRHTSVMGMETPRRRKRTTFSKAQLSELERTFSLTQYPDVKIKESLSSLTGLAESKIQVWFQNRRARYFKNKKSKRELKSFNLNNVHPHISTRTPNSSASRFYHSLSPRYPSPSFPQYGEVPNMLPPPTSPIAADQATNYIERKRFALAQETVGHYPDFTGCSDVFLSNKSPNGWNFLQEFDALFGDDQGSLPSASRCAAANHNIDNGLLSEVKDLIQFHDFTDGRQEQTKVPDDISELCLQELSEFDLEISPAMIDYLLSE